MKKILVTAYAVNPYKGSEDGTGWNISKELARYNKVTVITRKNNRPEIERYLSENPDPVHDNMRFAYHDLPEWAMFWKKKIGERRYVLYFYLWQLLMPVFIKRNKFEFDIAHSLNFHSDSQPHFLWVFRKPVFWGPIGHHPPVPKQYLKGIYPTKDYVKDRLYYAVKWCMRNLDPFFHICRWRSERIFVINSGIAKSIRCNPAKTVLVPAVATEQTGFTKREKPFFNILSVGRFVYMKGFDITIRAFAHFYKNLGEEAKTQVRLTLVGTGEAKQLLKKIAKENGISHAINWIDWVDKSEMERLYEESDIFLYPSHEGAGMVVVEAMAKGIPVVCFENYGPGELLGDAGFTVPHGPYDKTITAFGETLHWLYEYPDLREDMSGYALERAIQFFNWELKGRIINNQYDNALKVNPGKNSSVITLINHE